MSVPYDRPDAHELIDAVGDFLAEQVMGAVDGQLAFHVRVAANALRIAGRELRAAPESAAAHAERLARFGCADDRELREQVDQMLRANAGTADFLEPPIRRDDVPGDDTRIAGQRIGGV